MEYDVTLVLRLSYMLGVAEVLEVQGILFVETSREVRLRKRLDSPSSRGAGEKRKQKAGQPGHRPNEDQADSDGMSGL